MEIIISWRYATNLENTTGLCYRVDLVDVPPEWVTLEFLGTTGFYIQETYPSILGVQFKFKYNTKNER